MGDIEETIFKRNIPGKYSTWRDEAYGDGHPRSLLKEQSQYDDEDNDEDNGSGSKIQQERQQKFEDLSDIPISVRDSILSERSSRHATGVKVLLYHHHH